MPGGDTWARLVGEIMDEREKEPILPTGASVELIKDFTDVFGVLIPKGTKGTVGIISTKIGRVSSIVFHSPGHPRKLLYWCVFMLGGVELQSLVENKVLTE